LDKQYHRVVAGNLINKTGNIWLYEFAPPSYFVSQGFEIVLNFQTLPNYIRIDDTATGFDYPAVWAHTTDIIPQTEKDYLGGKQKYARQKGTLDNPPWTWNWQYEANQNALFTTQTTARMWGHVFFFNYAYYKPSYISMSYGAHEAPGTLPGSWTWYTEYYDPNTISAFDFSKILTGNELQIQLHIELPPQRTIMEFVNWDYHWSYSRRLLINCAEAWNICYASNQDFLP
jgi:hypothetical protein